MTACLVKYKKEIEPYKEDIVADARALIAKGIPRGQAYEKAVENVITDLKDQKKEIEDSALKAFMATGRAEKKKKEKAEAAGKVTHYDDGTPLAYTEEKPDTAWDKFKRYVHYGDEGWKNTFDFIGAKIVDPAASVARKFAEAGVGYVGKITKDNGKLYGILLRLHAHHARENAARGLKEGALVLNEAGLPTTTKVKNDLGEEVNFNTISDSWGALHHKLAATKNPAFVRDMMTTLWYAPRYRALIARNMEIDKKIESLRTDKGKGWQKKVADLESRRVSTADWTARDEKVANEAEELFGPEMDKIRDDWNAVREPMIRFMQETQLYDKATAEEYIDRMEYAPLYRVQEKDFYDTQGKPLRVNNGLLGMGKEHTLEGSMLRADDPIVNLAHNMMWMYERGIRNNAAVHLADDMHTMELGKWLGREPTENEKKSGHLITLWKNGEPKNMLVYDAHDAMAFLATPHVSGLAADIFRKGTSLVRHSVTITPQFAIRQVVDDAIRSAEVAGNKQGILRNIAENAVSLFNNQMQAETKEAHELHSHGIGGHTDLVDTMAEHMDMMSGKDKSGWKKYGMYFDRMSSGSDLASRETVYRAAIKEGNTPSEASLKALLYFPNQRRGMSQSLAWGITMVPFLNAWVQGNARTLSAALGKVPGVTRSHGFKLLLATNAKIAAFTAMYTLMNADNDDYKSQGADAHSGAWMIGPIKFPVPQELQPFKTLTEQGLNTMMGQKGAGTSAREVGHSIVANMWGLNPLQFIPAAIRPAAEVIANEDFRQLRPIVGRGLENLEPGEQSTHRTSPIAKGIGQSINLSPAKIQHLIDGYLGYVGSTASAMQQSVKAISEGRTPNYWELPVLSALTVNPEGGGLKDALYKGLDEVAMYTGTVNKMKLEGRYDEMNQYMDEHKGTQMYKGQIQNLHNQITKLRQQKIRMEAKGEDATPLDAQGNRVLQNIHEIIMKMHEANG